MDTPKRKHYTGKRLLEWSTYLHKHRTMSQREEHAGTTKPATCSHHQTQSDAKKSKRKYSVTLHSYSLLTLAHKLEPIQVKLVLLIVQMQNESHCFNSNDTTLVRAVHGTRMEPKFLTDLD